MRYDIVRLWYSTGSRCWIVDCGPGTAERYTDRVFFDTKGETHLNTEGQWPDGPYGWLSFKDVRMHYDRTFTSIQGAL